MSEMDAVPQIIRSLLTLGFSYVEPQDEPGWVKMRGPLQTSLGRFECELLVDRLSFHFPHVKLLDIPPSLRPVAPHISANGSLCYYAAGTLVFDIFDPVGQNIMAVHRAEHVLDCILRGEMPEDLEEEFHAYWGVKHCYIDVECKQSQQLTALTFNAREMFVVTDDEQRTSRKAAALGMSSSNSKFLIYKITTKAKPRPRQGVWPPATVGDVLAWQSLLDTACRRKIEKRIALAFRSGARETLIIVESPLMPYGIVVDIPPESREWKLKMGRHGKEHLYRLRVTPVFVTRLDDRFIAQRNIPNHPTLAGLKIGQVGCGTIGGYLAEMLMKAGAGTGGGHLSIVDPDALQPENLGRHRLGFNQLFVNKAVALSYELKRSMPTADIRPLPVDVREADLGDLDLLIDATGEESLGYWLTRRYHREIPILSVWIEGAGVAVRSLLKARSEDACYRCLCDYNKSKAYLAVNEEVEQVLAGQGCEALYVPFPATVSIQAASLGAEAVLDWAAKSEAPSLSTRVLRRDFTAATADCVVPARVGCPACAS